MRLERNYPVAALAVHPGANVNHNPFHFSRKKTIKHPITGEQITFIALPRNPGRWMPHNGQREMARRVRQMAP